MQVYVELPESITAPSPCSTPNIATNSYGYNDVNSMSWRQLQALCQLALAVVPTVVVYVVVHKEMVHIL